jgi:hypothetical protein
MQLILLAAYSTYLMSQINLKPPLKFKFVVLKTLKLYSVYFNHHYAFRNLGIVAHSGLNTTIQKSL